MKKCPYCAEEIQDEAVVCKHCGRDLRQGIQAPVPTVGAAAPVPAKKKRPILWILLAGVLLMCLCGVIGVMALSGGDKNERVSAVDASGKPLPTETPIFKGKGEYPPADPDLYKQIIENKDKMTDLQFKDFVDKQIGKRVHLEGSVTEVYPDGRVQINPKGSSLLSWATLYDIPNDIAMGISKDKRISVDVTVTGVTDIIGLSVDCNDPVIYWVK